MSQSIAAIPTQFQGIQYKSRLEARFAQVLHEASSTFIYEPAFISTQGYTPDFYLELIDIYVEVKPRALIRELSFFKNDITMSQNPWICIDSPSRGTWEIIAANPSFLFGFSIDFPLPARFEIVTVGLWPRLRVYPEFIDVLHDGTEELVV